MGNQSHGSLSGNDNRTATTGDFCADPISLRNENVSVLIDVETCRQGSK